MAVCAVKADDLQYLTKQQAIETMQLLQNQKYALLYCSCCGSDSEKTYVKLTKTYYRYTGYEEYYEVIVEGVDQNGNMVSKAIDLAYAYIKKGKKAVCLGLTLKYFCMPCEKKLKWECGEF